MPEGHTLHRLADRLTEVFGGHRVRVSSPQGRFAAGAERLDGSRLLDADAWGKQLFARFEGERFVHVHLGLYGTFDVHDDVDAVPEAVGQVRLRLLRPAAERPAAYGDLRGPTACKLVTAEERDAVVARIGPDPLRCDADPDRAWARVRRSSAPIGTLLMDQSVLAGVGNVYRAEVLFRHRIHPLRPGRTLRVSQWRAIWDDLVVLMTEGVGSGRIDTVRPEHTPEAMGREPRVDDHGGEVYVYRRAGQPCHVCGTAVRADVLGGRNLFWCARCQPVFRSRASGEPR
ncbi:Fpg/Nei family DNA glycosylase [Nocardioides sp. zg-536]|uniref:DNA-(apurinic or apyrimidinic site) lyase n=1 Tax=Nocardioides faecalis TaxID=2803858 RepID=A0A938Y706_9ACTN|nr:DNA-formamidopyrimidine glycosylase family protein [Nocardioides faecalis]MBM9459383.1 Fpg/Nei family DNA glycosylase [Nocardioides faecalis]MBS4751624.1 Fpg/Nei family DNA glycosylase [Nocardioides faecalis]QVI59508.1 Fpg/Nei family DNA glycosylase [Nocardioides faecalis]